MDQEERSTKKYIPQRNITKSPKDQKDPSTLMDQEDTRNMVAMEERTLMDQVEAVENTAMAENIKSIKLD